MLKELSDATPGGNRIVNSYKVINMEHALGEDLNRNYCHVNACQANVLILRPPKTPENVFRGHNIGILARNGLMSKEFENFIFSFVVF